jgi:hypothetical protein
MFSILCETFHNDIIKEFEATLCLLIPEYKHIIAGVAYKLLITSKEEKTKHEALRDITNTNTQEVLYTGVQAHGKQIETDLCLNVYKATPQELASVKYTNKTDLPSRFNRINKANISVKSTGHRNTVCMGDMLRLFDCVSNGEEQHLLVVHYEQTENIKQVKHIVEVNITDKKELLFGDLSREDIEELNRAVKVVKHKSRPTKDQHATMYHILSEKKQKAGAIIPNIKCDSTQSRLQCSFNRFRDFIDENPTLIIEQSNTNIFHGSTISMRYESPPRKFKKGTTTSSVTTTSSSVTTSSSSSVTTSSTATSFSIATSSTATSKNRENLN